MIRVKGQESRQRRQERGRRQEESRRQAGRRQGEYPREYCAVCCVLCAVCCVLCAVCLLCAIQHYSVS